MPRRTGARRRYQPEPQPFERSEAEWRRLGAPAELFDLQLAAAAEIAEHGAILEPHEPGFPGPPGTYAARWWRVHRWRFLQDAGVLTARERAVIARDPKRYRARP